MSKTTISNKNIWKIAYPIILGSLAQTFIILTDTAFLGRVSEIALGAVAISGVYYYMYSIIAWGFAMGVQIIIARRLGENNIESIGKTFHHGLVITSIFALGFLSVMYFFTNDILSRIISSENINIAANGYMKYRQWGILFVCFNYLFRALYVGLSNTKVIIYTTVIMSISNVILNYILIFGHLGFSPMGVEGAAIASTVSEAICLLVFIGYTIIKLDVKKYAISKFHKIKISLVFNVLKVSMPTMFQKLLSYGTWFIFFTLIEHLGERQAAISMIIRSLYGMLIIPVYAFAATSNTIISRLIGEGRSNEVMPTLYKILRLSLLSIIPLILICLIFPQFMLSIYTNNQDLILAAIPSVYVIAVGAVAICIGAMFLDAVSGTGNTMKALILETIILVLYTIYICIIAYYIKAEIHIVWTSEVVYGFLLAAICWSYMKFANWRNYKL